MVFLSFRDPFFLGFPSWRAGPRALPLFLWIHVFSRVCVALHNFLLENIDLLLSVVRNLHCFIFLCPKTCLGCSSARGGLFKLPSTRREMLLTNCLFQVSDHFFVQSVAVPVFNRLNSILHAQRQPWLQLL